MTSQRVNISGLSGLALESIGWDATETRARLAAGEVSAVEVVQAAIDRAEALDAQLGAIVHTDYDAARAAARTPAAGVFGGVPTFIKDMENLQGAPTRYGAQAFTPKPAPATAPTPPSVACRCGVPAPAPVAGANTATSRLGTPVLASDGAAPA
jgi:hypothetical protein